MRHAVTTPSHFPILTHRLMGARHPGTGGHEPADDHSIVVITSALSAWQTLTNTSDELMMTTHLFMGASHEAADKQDTVVIAN